MKPEPPSEVGANSENPLPPTEQPSEPKAESVSPPAKTPQPSMARRLWPIVMLVVLVGLAITAWIKQDELLDWAETRDYHPNQAVQQLVTDGTMTPYAQRLFYVNHPAIEARDAFNQHCTDASEQVAVLGCYRGDRQGIYLYAVTDQRLAGIQQVTAAHEMLHQAYDRLNSSERRRIDGLLQSYAKTITDQSLKDKLAIYEKTEPQDLADEMHSVFGTEVETLPADLETYYQQYFSSRHQLIALHAQYKAAFDQRNAQIATYDQQIATLKPEIENRRQALDVKEQDLRAQRSHMQDLLLENQVNAYNAMVPSFNSQVAAYRSEVSAVNELVRQYNQIIDARNKIAVEEQELINAQDSHAASADQQ